MTFKVGDLVVLKSSGPTMTVREVNQDVVTCVWFEKGKADSMGFPTETLAPYKPYDDGLGLGGFA